jgi:hypothetical protein
MNTNGRFEHLYLNFEIFLYNLVLKDEKKN